MCLRFSCSYWLQIRTSISYYTEGKIPFTLYIFVWLHVEHIGIVLGFGVFFFQNKFFLENLIIKILFLRLRYLLGIPFHEPFQRNLVKIKCGQQN